MPRLRKKKSKKEETIPVLVKKEPEVSYVEEEPKWPTLRDDEVVEIGFSKSNGSLQIGAHTVTHDKPLVTNNPYGLPVGWEELERLDGVTLKVVRKAELEEKPVKVIKKVEEKKPGFSFGVMWTGGTKFRTTAYGKFEKNVPRFNLPEHVIDELTARGGWFVRVAK